MMLSCNNSSLHLRTPDLPRTTQQQRRPLSMSRHKLGIPNQVRPCRRTLRKYLKMVSSRAHWWLGLSTLFLILVVLLKPAWWGTPTLLRPAPAWATPVERDLIRDTMIRWLYSVGICEGCSTYRHKQVIAPRHSLCAPSGGKDPELLIIVSTIHRNKQHRCLIRNTWGTYTLNNTGQVRLLFLFGKDPLRNTTEERLLQVEGAAFGDILQDDFNSTYRPGGEIQLIMGYRWAVSQCANVNHVLKVSDDTFVNVPRMLDMIRTVNLTNSIWGQCWNLSYPNRNHTHKWYISPENWPAPTYPKYCAGAYMGVTQEVIRKLLLVVPYVAWSSGNDDVLIGQCAEKLGVPTRDVPGFYVWDRYNPCRTPGPKLALHFHGHSPDILRYFWSRRDCFERRHHRKHLR